MSMPANQDNYTYVLPGGQVLLTAVFQTYAWSGIEQPVSGVQITITPVAGGAAVVGPTSTGITQVDEATYTYQWQPGLSTAPGDYQVSWTAASPAGIAPIQLGVTVVALPAESPSPGVYATIGQYQAWAQDFATPAQLISGMLRRASEAMDVYLIGAVYPVDADGMPTNPSHIDLFMRACCAQCQFELANNDPALVKSQYASVNMGGVSQTRTAKAQGQALPPLAPRAAAILQTGGALGTAPLVNWLRGWRGNDGAGQHPAHSHAGHRSERLRRRNRRRHRPLHRHSRRGRRGVQDRVRPGHPAAANHPHHQMRRTVLGGHPDY